MSEQRAKKRLLWAQSADIARAMASICNNERALFGVMSGNDRKILSLSREMRHDLAQQPVEALTAEQVHHALIEVFGRRGARSRADLRPKLRQRVAQAFEASGKPINEFADMCGLHVLDANRTLERARTRQQTLS